MLHCESTSIRRFQQEEGSVRGLLPGTVKLREGSLTPLLNRHIHPPSPPAAAPWWHHAGRHQPPSTDFGRTAVIIGV